MQKRSQLKNEHKLLNQNINKLIKYQFLEIKGKYKKMKQKKNLEKVGTTGHH